MFQEPYVVLCSIFNNSFLVAARTVLIWGYFGHLKDMTQCPIAFLVVMAVVNWFLLASTVRDQGHC